MGSDRSNRNRVCLRKRGGFALAATAHRVKTMNNSGTTAEDTPRANSATRRAASGPALEFPQFAIPSVAIPNLAMPEPMRELAEKTGAQAKDNYERAKAATDEMTAVVEASFATGAKGATEYGLKVMELARANTASAFVFIGRLMSVKSPFEAMTLITTHAHQQFVSASNQNKELLALAQTLATNVGEPIRTCMSKTFERKA